MAGVNGGHWKVPSQHLPVFVCWRAGRRRCTGNPLEDDPVTGPRPPPDPPPRFPRMHRFHAPTVIPPFLGTPRRGRGRGTDCARKVGAKRHSTNAVQFRQPLRDEPFSNDVVAVPAGLWVVSVAVVFLTAARRHHIPYESTTASYSPTGPLGPHTRDRIAPCLAIDRAKAIPSGSARGTGP